MISLIRCDTCMVKGIECMVLKTRKLGEVKLNVRSFIGFSKQKVGVMTKHDQNRISNRQYHLGFCS
jgi:hypothetical protein